MLNHSILTTDEIEVLKRVAVDCELDIESACEYYRVFDLPDDHELYQRLKIVDKIIAHEKQLQKTVDV